jgi:hypothetical protein
MKLLRRLPDFLRSILSRFCLFLTIEPKDIHSKRSVTFPNPVFYRSEPVQNAVKSVKNQYLWPKLGLKLLKDGKNIFYERIN